jgi:hypothetical protein
MSLPVAAFGCKYGHFRLFVLKHMMAAGSTCSRRLDPLDQRARIECELPSYGDKIVGIYRNNQVPGQLLLTPTVHQGGLCRMLCLDPATSHKSVLRRRVVDACNQTKSGTEHGVGSQRNKHASSAAGASVSG